jgi:hypothetical protein
MARRYSRMLAIWGVGLGIATAVLLRRFGRL